MRHIEIEGANAHPGAPANWDPAVDGTCGVLPVRATYRKDSLGNDRVQTCESAWVPTPEELAMLNAGGSVVLTVCGWQVPVSLRAEPPLPICILATNHVEADRWYRAHPEETFNGLIQCVYAINAEVILGMHFSRVVELKRFDERQDADALRSLAISRLRTTQEA